MTIVRWEPLRELNSLQSEMNRLFNTAFDARGASGAALRRWVPAMDLVESGDQFVLRADLPGMIQEDIQIESRTARSPCRASARPSTRSAGGLPSRGARFGAFSRSLTLPRASTPTPSPRASTAGCSRSASRARGEQAAPHLDRRRWPGDHRGPRGDPAA